MKYPMPAPWAVILVVAGVALIGYPFAAGVLAIALGAHRVLVNLIILAGQEK